MVGKQKQGGTYANGIHHIQSKPPLVAHNAARGQQLKARSYGRRFGYMVTFTKSAH